MPLSSLLNSTCGQNCATCLTLSGQATCTNCLPGYVLSASNQCIPCMTNCSVCTLNKNTQTNNQPVCIGCSIGYYLNPLSGQCTNCGMYCAGCFNSTVCVTCLPGYSITSNYQCIVRCIYPCTTCSSTNQASCNSCQAGFTLNTNNNTCTPTCTSSSTTCSICPLGSSINVVNSVQTCVSCTASSACARCDSTNPSVCISCAFGLYLSNSSTCVACSTGCSNCINLNTCFRCMIGYVAVLPASLVTGASIN